MRCYVVPTSLRAAIVASVSRESHEERQRAILAQRSDERFRRLRRDLCDAVKLNEALEAIDNDD